MEKQLKEKIVTYYYDALLNSYIYSDDLNSFLEQRNITNEDWFLPFMNANLEFNKKCNIFGYNERQNCYTMLNNLLFKSIEDKNSEMVDRCNELIIKLNKSNSDNEYDYLEKLYISNSPNEKMARKLIDNEIVDLDTVKDYFYYSTKLSYYLLSETEDFDKILLSNEYVVFSIVEITKKIPEVFSDVDIITKLYSIIFANKDIIKSTKHDSVEHKYFIKENRDAKKYLKKAYRKA